MLLLDLLLPHHLFQAECWRRHPAHPRRSSPRARSKESNISIALSCSKRDCLLQRWTIPSSCRHIDSWLVKTSSHFCPLPRACSHHARNGHLRQTQNAYAARRRIVVTWQMPTLVGCIAFRVLCPSPMHAPESCVVTFSRT